MDAHRPKQFKVLGDRPLIVHTLQRLSASPLIEMLVVVVPPDWVAKAETEIIEPFGLEKVVALVAGGRRRQDSVEAGLKALPREVEVVVVHDGVRPFVSTELVASVVEAAKREGAAIAALALADTLKRVAGEWVEETLSRQGLYLVQTPQAFRRHLLEEAFERARARSLEATDEAALVEALGYRVKVVEGSVFNIKVTTQEDWALAETILRALGEEA